MALAQFSTPTVAQPATKQMSCVVRGEFPISSAQVTRSRRHIVALEFAHENPPSPNAVDNDNNSSTENSLAPQNIGTGLVLQNTQV